MQTDGFMFPLCEWSWRCVNYSLTEFEQAVKLQKDGIFTEVLCLLQQHSHRTVRGRRVLCNLAVVESCPSRTNVSNLLCDDCCSPKIMASLKTFEPRLDILRFNFMQRSNKQNNSLYQATVSQRLSPICIQMIYTIIQPYKSLPPTCVPTDSIHIHVQAK